jgi:serine/threonine protein kinase/Tol biopolymer transport system component
MLVTGTRIGPYQILAPLGTGGMGEVYRARDSRLGRDVAIKILPEHLVTDRDRLARFEKEARAASALNHPNVVTVYDIGFQDSMPYLAMEIVEGTTIRHLLDSSGMPIRKLLEIGTQIAEGLAKAHLAGIVHRDLKPENIMITGDGYVKILDFGLAKLTEQQPDGAVSNAPTAATLPGTVMGTAGYMAPEQASGRAVDFRTDQFSLGTVLYEMATGRKAFHRPSTAEILVAIIRDEPEPIAQLNTRLPVPLRWIIERCLAKDPEERYASTRDLALDLATVRDHLSETLTTAELGESPASAETVPTFQRLSFRRGTILSARFAQDGQTVIYGAWWEGSPCRLFSTRPESPESSALQLPDADILSISRTGMMAISLERRWAGRFIWTGTLAQVPIVGGAPREILEDVEWADWAPDGVNLAIVRQVSGKHLLEYPIGNVLYETAGWISHPRVSPKGDLVAFIDHSVQGDDTGSIVVIDRDRKMNTLTQDWITAYGLAWSSDGNEIWFTATRIGVARAIWAVSLDGRERLLARTPGELTIHDVSRDRVLITSDNGKVGMIGLPPGQSKEKDLSLLDWSRVEDISADGKLLLFDESGEGGGAAQGVYLRKTDGSPAVRLGDGRAFGFSPDGRWVATRTVVPPRDTILLPVKAGVRRIIPRSSLSIQAVHWVPDGQRLLLAASEPGRSLRLYLQNIDGGEPHAISPEGVGVGFFPISPDGKFVVAQGADQQFYLFPLEGGDPQLIPSLSADDRPIRWTPVGHSIYIFRRGELPGQVFLLDLSTGRKEPVRELMPPDPAGVVEIVSAQLTADAASYAYSYHRILSDLFLVEGLQ